MPIDKPTLSESFDQLVSVVAEEAEHCERLLALLRQQQTCLVQCDTKGLEANVRRQEHAVRMSRELEQKRRALVRRIAATSGLDEVEPNLSRLIAATSDDYGRRLAGLRTSMKQAVENVNKIKEQNRTLIEQSMFNINEVIRMLAAAGRNGGDYATVATGETVTAPLSVDRVG